MSDRKGIFTPRLVLGFALMALGSVFLLDELNMLDLGDVIRWWPLIPMAVGASMVLQPGGSSHRTAGGVLVAFGAWVLLYDFDIIGFDLFDIWPALLIGLGAFVVWRSMAGASALSTGPVAPAPVSPSAPATAPATAPVTPPVTPPGAAPAGASFGAQPSGPEDSMSVFAFLNHIERSSASRVFQGADLTAIMGGCTIDLRGADIGPGGVVIDAFAFWGGIEIIVPEDWVVTNKVMPLLGGAEDRSRAVAGASKQVLVRGSAIMGGVEINNQKQDRSRQDAGADMGV